MNHLMEVIAHLFHPRRSNNHRPRVLHPELMMLFVFLAGAFTFSVYRTNIFVGSDIGSILGYAANISADQVIAQTNQQRAAHGLGSLSYNGQLAQAAAGKAQDMFAHQYWAHVSPSGVQPWAFIAGAGYSYQWAGENLARDFQNTSDMMNAWMNSPTHKENIVNSKYTEIGVAVVDGNLLGQETTLVVQMFGTPKQSAQSAGLIPQVQAEEVEQVAAAETPTATPVPPTPTATVAPTIAPTVVVQVSPTEVPEPIPSTEQEVVKEYWGGNTSPVSESITQKNSGTADYIPSNGVKPGDLISPLVLLRAFFLALLVMLGFVLIYDFMVVAQKNTVRLVGKNLAHVIVLMTVGFLLLFFRSGTIL